VGVVNEAVSDETLKVVEVTPYRLETGYSDKRRPDAVTFSGKLADDLKRRDFTINAIALQLGSYSSSKKTYTGELVDLFKGQEDLEKGIIRTVGNPGERFGEDSLRLLRGIRIAAELNFSIEQDTELAIKNKADLLKHIAPERIRDEFFRIIMSDRPHEGLELCHKLGILHQILPEVVQGIGVAQNQAHSFDVFEHSMKTLAHGAKKGFPLEIRLAALFHDIGKPPTRRWSDEKKDWTFYGHDMVGAKIASKIMARLKFPTDLAEKVTKLVRWHMFFSDTEQITLSAVRRMLARVGPDNIWGLMNVRACDRIGTGRPKESPYRLRKYHSMIEEVLRDPVSVGMLKINGSKIMGITGITPGPKIGYILHALLEEVLEDPKKNVEVYLEEKTLQLSKLGEKELETLGRGAKEKKEEEDEKVVKEIRKKYWVD